MGAHTTSQLKEYFQTGFKPTEQNFSDFIDSSVLKADAAIEIDTERKYMGIGPIKLPIGNRPQERLHVAGGILLGMSENNNPGTIRWNDKLKDFQLSLAARGK